MRKVLQLVPARQWLPSCLMILGTSMLSSVGTYAASGTEVTQQSKRVRGTVVDAAGNPIIGASVMQKGTANGCITDIDGKFAFDAPKGSTVAISYVGYRQQEFVVSTGEAVEIVLQEIARDIDDVVVVGYGTQKKVNLTGSVATIKSDQLQNRVATNVTNLLTGQMTGVTIQQTSGQPGADTGTLRVRGIGTMNSGSSAMVIVDGVESTLGSVDPNDIDNISILKDAAASAIYGVRAANGVILVTTKRGAEGKAKVSYDGYIGWQEATRLPKFVNSYDFATLMNEAYSNDGTPDSSLPYSSEELTKLKNGSDPVNYPNSDWLGTLLSENGLFHNHHVAVTGGSKTANYSVSLGYHNKEGLIPNTAYEKISFRSNLSAQINSRLSIQMNLSGYCGNTKAPAEGVANIIHYAYRETPVTPIMVNGQYVRFKNEHNSIASAKEGGLQRIYEYGFQGTAALEYKIMDGLKLRGSASTRYVLDENDLHYKTMQYYSPGDYENLKSTTNSIYNRDYKTLEVNLQAYLDYQKTFGKHAVGGLLGYSQIYNKYRYLTAYRKNLPSSNTLDQIDAGEEAGMQNGGNEIEYALRSAFGRVNYAFDDRYLFEFNLRYDGSSRFAKNNRFGAFPSVSVGWRISEEDFFKAQWVDNLKLRASWGLLGNQEIDDYAFYNTYAFGYNYGFGGTKVSTISITSPMANENITWEKTEQINVGLDAAFFGSKLTLSADFFRKQTRDILLTLPILDMVGVGAPYQNAGAVRNTGFELQIGHSNRIGELQYSATANISYVKNKITDLKGADTPGQSVGDPLSAYYGYVCEGIFRTQQDIDNHADQSTFGTPVLGDLMYRDTNHDNVVNSNDRVILGSSFPKWNFGLNLSASYKGFDLSTILQGTADVKAMTRAEVAYAFYNGGTLTTKYLDRWTPTNVNGSMPRLSMSNSSNRLTSSFWVNDASYLKMRNLQLGYTIPTSIVAKAGISRLRVYCSIDNVFVITGFEGTDPEATGNVHPLTRSYAFGVNLSF